MKDFFIFQKNDFLTYDVRQIFYGKIRFLVIESKNDKIV